MSLWLQHTFCQKSFSPKCHLEYFALSVPNLFFGKIQFFFSCQLYNLNLDFPSVKQFFLFQLKHNKFPLQICFCKNKTHCKNATFTITYFREPVPQLNCYWQHISRSFSDSGWNFSPDRSICTPRKIRVHLETATKSLTWFFSKQRFSLVEDPHFSNCSPASW